MIDKDSIIKSIMNHLRANLEPHVFKSLRGQQTEELVRCMADWVIRREISKNLNESPAEMSDFMEELKKI